MPATTKSAWPNQIQPGGIQSLLRSPRKRQDRRTSGVCSREERTARPGLPSELHSCAQCYEHHGLHAQERFKTAPAFFQSNLDAAGCMGSEGPEGSNVLLEPLKSHFQLNPWNTAVFSQTIYAPLPACEAEAQDLAVASQNHTSARACTRDAGSVHITTLYIARPSCVSLCFPVHPSDCSKSTRADIVRSHYNAQSRLPQSSTHQIHQRLSSASPVSPARQRRRLAPTRSTRRHTARAPAPSPAAGTACLRPCEPPGCCRHRGLTPPAQRDA